MAQKKEDNEQQKRQAARAARRAGSRPSAVGATSGASKQRHHLGAHEEPAEKLRTKPTSFSAERAARAVFATLPKAVGQEEYERVERELDPTLQELTA